MFRLLKPVWQHLLVRYNTSTNKPSFRYVVALSLREQIVPIGEIPLEETDQMLDYVLTPENIF